MFARLHARDDFKVKTKGRHLEITTSGFEAMAEGGKLVVKAEEWEHIGPKGDRPTWMGAAPSERNVERTLTLELTPEELAKLFNAAVQAGLITVGVEPACQG